MDGVCISWTIQTAVTGDFDDVLDTTVAALEDEGFGVLCDIDIRATLQEKLYETDDGDIIVSAVDPKQLVGIADNDALDAIGTEVTDRFDRVLSAVADEQESTSEA